MNPPPLAGIPRAASFENVPLRRIVLSVLGLTFWADFLLWPARPGISLVFFVAGLALALWLNRPPDLPMDKRVPAGFLLLAGALIGTVLELCFSNVLVLFTLLLFLLGGIFYPDLSSAWARTSEAAWAFCKAPGRWIWFLAVLVDPFRESTRGFFGLVSKSLWLVAMAAPAVVLGSLFAWLLGSGNAVLGDAFTHLFARWWDWLRMFDLSLARILFWLGIATAAFVWVRPAASSSRRWWVRPLPGFAPPSDVRLALWRSGLILGVMNLLFMATNGIDAFYLWTNLRLPDGVSYSKFVHQGTYQMIAAVLLAAVVLTALFHQAALVRESRLLKFLAQAWILQNLILAGSVLRRLLLYVEAYQLSELRVGVALFLLLVCSGFLLLAVHIQTGGSLGLLLTRNAAAVFTLFYLLQFVDIAGAVAHYNVHRWEQDPNRGLDTNYLQQLGTPAWPALLKASSVHVGTDPQRKAVNILRFELESEKDRRKSANWRSWQWRSAVFGNMLIEAEPLLNPIP
jgi:hypothetical protein